MIGPYGSARSVILPEPFLSRSRICLVLRSSDTEPPKTKEDSLNDYQSFEVDAHPACFWSWLLIKS